MYVINASFFIIREFCYQGNINTRRVRGMHVEYVAKRTVDLENEVSVTAIEIKKI